MSLLRGTGWLRSSGRRLAIDPALKYFLFHYVRFKNPETNRKFIAKSNKQSDSNNTTMGIVEQMQEISRQEGVQKGLETAVRKLLTNTEFSMQKIAEMMEVPISLVKKVKKDLKTK
jgi:hypothetical protein